MEKLKDSVVEDLDVAHKALLADLRKLEEGTASASANGLGQLRARLSIVQAHITEHFCFEERNGYMDQVRKRAPNLERTIQELAQEHGKLARSLNALIEAARTARSLDSTLCSEVREWVRCVRDHEERETDLVQKVFNLEISAED